MIFKIHEAIEGLKTMLPELVKDIDNFSTAQMIFKIHEAMEGVKRAKANDHWLSPKGQEELEQMSLDQTRKGFNIFDYVPATKASLCAMASPEDERYEVELTADTRACYTAVPTLMCPGIRITPSVQSLRGMQYEVATGESIPNLGEKRCGMWSE